MAFRTDPRFETYNSSGYVYKRESKTLLLKSRQKSKVEEIRLELGDKAAETSAEKPAAKAATETESKSAETEAANTNTAASSAENSGETTTTSENAQ